MNAKLSGGFITPWEFDRNLEHQGRTYRLWHCQHREGYTALALTSPSSGRPLGSAHYTSPEGLTRTTGIQLT